METVKIEVHPATKERWEDLEKLFGERGAYSNCWCMFWRLKRVEFAKMKAEERKEALKGMTLSDQVPGVLATMDGKPVGWCSIGPREGFVALENSRLLKRLDGKPVWSIVCFFIEKSFRRQGVMTALVKGAVEYAREKGAQVVEAYPVDMHSSKLEGQKLTGCVGYMGLVSAFEKAGFKKVKAVSETQVVMRYSFE